MFRARLLSILLIGWCLPPTHAAAAWLGFRNDLNKAVVVQTYTECRGGIHPGTPHRLYPGETTWEWVGDQGARKAVVADAQKPNTILLRGVEVLVGKDDVLCNLQVDKAGAVQLRKTWEGKRPR